LNKENLNYEYVLEKKSLTDIRDKYNIDLKSICVLLKYYNIKVRDISTSTKMSSSKKKETCQKKYGVDWYSQTNKAKERKKETFQKKYGVDNIWKSEFFKRNLDKYYFEKHGLDRRNFYKEKWINLPEEDKNNIIKNWYSKCSYTSGLEKRVKSILDDAGISYLSNFIINHKSYDIIIDKSVIEIQGDFWHANPEKYKKDDLLNYPGGKKIKAEDLWIKDKLKKDEMENMGYKILYLWETNINKMKDSDILLTIEDFIKK
jgi:G:T-mismatch repair DNA endonuclease (very short patch repair protein)